MTFASEYMRRGQIWPLYFTQRRLPAASSHWYARTAASCCCSTAARANVVAGLDQLWSSRTSCARSARRSLGEHGARSLPVPVESRPPGGRLHHLSHVIFVLVVALSSLFQVPIVVYTSGEGVACLYRRGREE